MSTACGRPQGGACGQGEGGQKPDFFVDVINGRPLALLFVSSNTPNTTVLSFLSSPILATCPKRPILCLIAFCMIVSFPPTHLTIVSFVIFCVHFTLILLEHLFRMSVTFSLFWQ